LEKFSRFLPRPFLLCCGTIILRIVSYRIRLRLVAMEPSKGCRPLLDQERRRESILHCFVRISCLHHGVFCFCRVALLVAEQPNGTVLATMMDARSVPFRCKQRHHKWNIHFHSVSSVLAAEDSYCSSYALAETAFSASQSLV
jgi:hypothetical protein